MIAGTVYAAGLDGARLRLVLEGHGPRAVDVGQWLGPITAADESVLERAVGPVLDVGCGPARHVRALARRGVLALGVDASPEAVRVARARGAAVVHGSIFEALPRPGSWASALLLDGSVGIGGAPVRLLRRVRDLLAPGGRVLVETDPPGSTTAAIRAYLDGPSGCSDVFPWALVGTDALPGIARRAGLADVQVWSCEGRWFGQLR